MAVVPIRKSPLARSTSFKKGTPKPPNSGRSKGSRNRVTTVLKDAILEAATRVGQDGRGKNGLTGYLMMLAVKEKAVYARLLERVLPMQLHVQDKTVPIYSAAEAVERLRERQLPVPPALLHMAEGARPIDSTDYEEELDGRGYAGADDPDPDAEDADADSET